MQKRKRESLGEGEQSLLMLLTFCCCYRPVQCQGRQAQWRGHWLYKALCALLLDKKPLLMRASHLNQEYEY